MTKKEILQYIIWALEKEKDNHKRNSMGVSESFYNPYFLIGKCFSKNELSIMNKHELNSLHKLANFASGSF